jgi:hypothetical protein
VAAVAAGVGRLAVTPQVQGEVAAEAGAAAEELQA